MNNTLRTTLLLLLVCMGANAQNSYLQWSKDLGGAGYDALVSVVPTMEGGSVSAGFTFSTDGDCTANHRQYASDAWVVKQKADGTVEWSKNYGGILNDYAYCILQTPDSGYIVAGSAASGDGDVINKSWDSLDAWVIKLKPDGSIAWAKTYGGYGDDEAHSITATADGGFIVAGYTRSNNGDLKNNHGNKDFFIFKIKSDGTLEWTKNYGGTDDEEANNVKATSDGGCIVVGYTKSSNKDITSAHGWVDIWVLKLASDGSMQWQRNVGGGGYDNATCVTPTLDSAYILAGQTFSRSEDILRPITDTGSAWLVKLDLKGTIIWQKVYGGPGANSATWITQLKDTDEYLVCGSTSSTSGDVTSNHGNGDAWVIKLKRDSIIEWQKTYGGSNSDNAECIAVASDGGYLFTGESKSSDGDVKVNDQKSTDAWAVKLNSKLLGIEPQSNQNAIGLYPNPVESTLFIDLKGQKPNGKITISDMSGKIVYTSNINSVSSSINISWLKNGIYIVRCQLDESGTTTKIIKE